MHRCRPIPATWFFGRRSVSRERERHDFIQANRRAGHALVESLDEPGGERRLGLIPERCLLHAPPDFAHAGKLGQVQHASTQFLLGTRATRGK